MPMFYTPKPRQFHYNPRYYDPEKEKWEDIKKKYGYTEGQANKSTLGEESGDAELRYFEEKVRNMEHKERTEAAKFGVRDLIRKREMPKFNYTPRFQDDGTLKEDYANPEKTKIRIGRRFDFDDENYMKPVSAGRIMLYALLVCVFLYWIIF